MAVRSNTNGVLSRTTNLPVNSTGWTFTMWLCSTDTEAAFRVPFLLGGAGGIFGALIVDTGTLNLSWDWNASPGYFSTALLTLTDEVPVFVAVKCISGTEIEVLWRAFGAESLSTTGVLTIGSATWTDMFALGDDVAGEEWSNAWAHSLRLWHAALSTAEILAESKSPVPVRTANIDSFLTLRDATDPGDDESGNARDWTPSGTFATVDYVPALMSLASATGTAHAPTASSGDAADLPLATASAVAHAPSALAIQPASLPLASATATAHAPTATSTQPASLPLATAQGVAHAPQAGGAILPTATAVATAHAPFAGDAPPPRRQQIHRGRGVGRRFGVV